MKQIVIKKWIDGEFREVKKYSEEEVVSIRHHTDGLEIILKGNIRLYDTQCIIEFKEEFDDNIGKHLLNWFKDCKWDAIDNETLKRDDIIAWLEKQCEQKPTDKVEPKFKVGDCVTNGIDFTFKVMSIKDDMYYRDDNYFIDIKTADKTFRLWTIQDAKDGDVLYIHSFESDCVFLYQNIDEIEPNRNVAVAYCCIDVYANKIEFGIQGQDCIDVRNVKPATKEQRDLLFQKMKEAGYEWDAEKKELKKIEQKPTWSEEDENKSQLFLAICDDIKECSATYSTIYREIEELKTWFNSFKERIKGE